VKKLNKKNTVVKFTRCPVCVNGRGQYKNIAAHNKRQHKGKTPKKIAA
jgi:hypothetical protein